MFEKIMVALDGSKNAEMVFPYVEEIAGKFNSEIDLVGVIESTSDLEHTWVGNITNDVLKMYLSEAEKRMVEEGVLFGIADSQRISSGLIAGHIAEKIISHASEIKADMIALTSRGSTSHEKWVLGNISAKVLRAATKPVLLIRKHAPANYVTERKLIRKILLPLDGSKLGEAAIPFAGALSEKLNAEVVLLHVMEPLNWEAFEALRREDLEKSLNSREKGVQEYLNKKAREIESQTGVSAATAMATGDPAQQIAEYANENQIDLIAISTHGRAGLAHWVFGSVADKTLHFGDTPVLLIRPKKE